VHSSQNRKLWVSREVCFVVFGSRLTFGQLTIKRVGIASDVIGAHFGGRSGLRCASPSQPDKALKGTVARREGIGDSYDRHGPAKMSIATRKLFDDPRSQ
jgi:hypothetical protein